MVVEMPVVVAAGSGIGCSIYGGVVVVLVVLAAGGGICCRIGVGGVGLSSG